MCPLLHPCDQQGASTITPKIQRLQAELQTKSDECTRQSAALADLQRVKAELEAREGRSKNETKTLTGQRDEFQKAQAAAEAR